VTAGKDGRLFLLNRDAMQSSGFNSAAALDTHQLSGCWCGPSFFMGSDGIGRVVTSAGSGLNTWQLQLSPSPKLVQEGTATIPTSSQDPGFFTVVSSNSTNAGTAIIWAVGRPVTTTAVTLYAFAATVSGGTYQLLFSSPADHGHIPEATRISSRLSPMERSMSPPIKLSQSSASLQRPPSKRRSANRLAATCSASSTEQPPPDYRDATSDQRTNAYSPNACGQNREH